MPQLNRVSVINSDLRVRKSPAPIINISPAIVGGNTIVNLRTYNGVLTLSANGSWNLTPITTFSANVMAWGAGGLNNGAANGGAGGFSTGIMTFFENVSYNVVVGRAGVATGGGGGGTGIEFIANLAPIIVAGGGGGGGSGRGGAGSGYIAQNSAASGTGASAYGSTSPGSYRGGGAGLGTGFSGPGGGGGGLYGGATNGGGGGGGGGFIDTPALVLSNTITGTNNTPPLSDYTGRGTGGDGGVSGVVGDGIIIITVL